MYFSIELLLKLSIVVILLLFNALSCFAICNFFQACGSKLNTQDLVKHSKIMQFNFLISLCTAVIIFYIYKV